MIWFLIVFSLYGQPGQPLWIAKPFNTEQECRVAGAITIDTVLKNLETRKIGFKCVPIDVTGVTHS